MIADVQLQFSAAQALTATATSTNIIDLSKQRGIGVGTPMALLVILDVAAKGSAGDETYTAQMQVCSTVGGSYSNYGPLLTITRGDAIGEQYVGLLPKDFLDNEFAQVNYTLGGTSPSVTVDAFLLPADHVDAYNAFPKGYSIK